MKIIISENQLSYIRRLSEVDRLIDPLMNDVYDYLQGENKYKPLNMRDYDTFESTVSMKLSNELANKSSLYGDDRVTLRNRLLRHIRNEYYTQIRDYFKQKIKK